MIAVFLAAEAGSARYGPRIRELLAGLGQPHGIAEHPDTGDAAANGSGGEVFTGMPAGVAWHHAALTPAELATVRYLDYDYWTDFSGGSRLAANGARRLGPWQDQPPGSGYRRIAEDPGRAAAPDDHRARRARPGEPGRHRGAQAADRAAGLSAVAARRDRGHARPHRPPPQVALRRSGVTAGASTGSPGGGGAPAPSPRRCTASPAPRSGPSRP